MNNLPVDILRKLQRIGVQCLKIAGIQSMLIHCFRINRSNVVPSNFSLEILAQRTLEISKALQIKKIFEFDLIRIGGPHDGGYVMVNNLENIEGILSLGIGPDASWDEEISQKVPLIHLYDHSIQELPATIPSAHWYSGKTR